MNFIKNKLYIIIILIILISICSFLSFPKKTYTDKDFGITTYKSSVDMDSDSLDDQTDILGSVKKYLDTKPKYKSKYYASGFPDDDYGVCTDVVGFGLLGAGYNLRELVNTDINTHSERYNIEVVDKNIDFRRVRNLNIYFKNNSISLTTNINEIDEWQAGDIVVFKNHIGIISDKRNSKGIPYVLHNGSPYQRHYEEDILKKKEKDIIGHYRIS